MRKKIIAALLVCVLIGVFIGYMIGTAVTIKVVAHMASGFLDKKLIEQAIFQYKNHISSCYPSQLENASIFTNTRT